MSHLVDMARENGKPLFGWLMGKRTEAHQYQMTARKIRLPVFGELYRAVECMAAVLLRKKIAAPGLPQQVAGISTAVRDSIRKMLPDRTGVLDEYQSKQLLSDWNVPVVEEQIITGTEEARNVAEKFGYPVVLKGLVPGEVHKTELDLVRIGLSSAIEAETVFCDLREKLSDGSSILIQKQVKGDVELIAGLIRDPQFGPCVMCGIGGILAEVIADSVFAAAPLTMEEAQAMIDRLKSQKLLNGFRGSRPVDRAKLAEILIGLGDLGVACEQIKEIDINPLIVSDGIPVAVDATIIVA
jgi:acetyltransferase